MNTRMDRYSVLVTILVFRLNMVVSAHSGSLALRAETAHDLFDPVASLSVSLGWGFYSREVGISCMASTG